MGDTAKHDGVKSTVQPERNTIGSDSAELRAKPDDRVEALELAFEANKTYLQEIEKVTQSEHTKGWVKPYYVCVLSSKHSTMVNVMRRRFYARQTIPAPKPRETVWKYFPLTGNLELKWALPNEDAINWILENYLTVPKDQKPMANMVMDYVSGRLHEKMHQEDPTIAQEIFGEG
jgi:hypothetical protein